MLDLNLKYRTDFRVRNGGKSESYCEAFVDIPYSVSEAQTPSKRAHKQVSAKQPPRPVLQVFGSSSDNKIYSTNHSSVPCGAKHNCFQLFTQCCTSPMMSSKLRRNHNIFTLIVS